MTWWWLLFSVLWCFSYSTKNCLQLSILWPKNILFQMCLPKSTPLLLEIITLVERMAFTSGQQNQGSQKISCHTTANKSYNFFFQKLPKNPHSSLLFDGFFLYSGRLFLITRANEAGCQEKNRDKSLNMCKCLANGKVVCFC